jgi:hypothetical protein
MLSRLITREQLDRLPNILKVLARSVDYHFAVYGRESKIYIDCLEIRGSKRATGP